MSASFQIREIAKRDPDISQADIARTLSCSPALVSKVLAKQKNPRFNKSRSSFPFLTQSNFLFITLEAEKNNVTRDEVLNAIVTDARLEDEK